MSRVGDIFDPDLGNSHTQSGSEGTQSKRVPNFLWVLTPGLNSFLTPPTEILTFEWLPLHPVPNPGTPEAAGLDGGSPGKKARGRHICSED